MRIFIFAALLAASLPSTSIAAETGRDCSKLLENLPAGLARTEATTIETLADGCAATHLALGSADYQRWEIGRFSLTGLDMTSNDMTPPDHLEARADGIAFAPRTDNAATNYMIKVQQRTFAIHVGYTYSEASKDVQFEAALDGEAIGSVSLRGTLLGIVPHELDIDTLPDPEKIAVSGMTLDLANKALVENFAFPAFIGFLSTVDPEQQVEDGKANATAMIAADPTLTPESKDALTRVVADFPHPRGKLHLELQPQSPIGFKDVDALHAPAALVGKIKLTATYDPAATQ